MRLSSHPSHRSLMKLMAGFDGPDAQREGLLELHLYGIGGNGTACRLSCCNLALTACVHATSCSLHWMHGHTRIAQIYSITNLGSSPAHAMLSVDLWRTVLRLVRDW